MLLKIKFYFKSVFSAAQPRKTVFLLCKYIHFAYKGIHDWLSTICKVLKSLESFAKMNVEIMRIGYITRKLPFTFSL